MKHCDRRRQVRQATRLIRAVMVHETEDMAEPWSGPRAADGWADTCPPTRVAVARWEVGKMKLHGATFDWESQDRFEECKMAGSATAAITVPKPSQLHRIRRSPPRPLSPLTLKLGNLSPCSTSIVPLPFSATRLLLLTSAAAGRAAQIVSSSLSLLPRLNTLGSFTTTSAFAIVAALADHLLHPLRHKRLRAFPRL
ncbi:hypothetical protein ANO11243_033130 [Dothideomycetidae sp. 11243]|nr:hypothetical protein ANO11243_033130 [fungal sp. No.11243]